MSSFQLYTADAIDLMRALPSESVDLIITDVAYESLEKHRAVGTTTRLKQSDASSNEWFPIFRNSRFGEFFQESFRVLKKNAHLYFYCDQETAFIAKPVGEAAGFKFWKPIVWAKTKQGTMPDADDLTVEHQAMGMGYHFRASYEFVLFFEKGKRKLNDLGVRDLLPFPVIRNGYPTEKPTDLNRVFVRQSSEAGETVLDPFMGSGSAGVAAVRNDRHFIGGDIKESAVEGARKRLLANAAADDGQVFSVVEGARSPEPEPPPKKTRAKKTSPTNVPPAKEAHAFEPRPDSRYCAACPCEEYDPIHITAPKYRAFAVSDGKVQGEVPNVMFEIKVSDEPLPVPEGPGIVAQLAETFGEAERKFEREFLAEPKLDGVFMMGPLPGGPSEHLTAPEIVPPPRPPSCQHGELRSVCILCRSKR